MRLLLALSLLLACLTPARAQISNLQVAQGAAGCIATGTCTAVVNGTKRIVFTSGCTLTAGAGGEADIDCSGGITPVPSTRTLTMTSPLACDGVAGASCDLSANRTLSIDLTLAYGWSGVHTWTTTAIGTAATVQATLQNTTAAALGAQQYSPLEQWCGNGWETGGSTSKSNCWATRTRPVQGVASTANFDFLIKQNGAASYTQMFTMSDDGTTPLIASGRAFLKLQASASEFIQMGSGIIYFASNGSTITHAMTSTSLYPQANAAVDLGIDGQAFKRLRLAGTIPTSTSFVFTGWGATCTSTPATCLTNILGNDAHLYFTVTPTGAGPTAAPTIAYTFKNSTWTTAPSCTATIGVTSTQADQFTFRATVTQTATVATITVNDATGAVAVTAGRTFPILLECTGY